MVTEIDGESDVRGRYAWTLGEAPRLTLVNHDPADPLQLVISGNDVKFGVEACAQVSLECAAAEL
jgi:hypothetical protein